MKAGRLRLLIIVPAEGGGGLEAEFETCPRGIRGSWLSLAVSNISFHKEFVVAIGWCCRTISIASFA